MFISAPHRHHAAAASQYRTELSYRYIGLFDNNLCLSNRFADWSMSSDQPTSNQSNQATDTRGAGSADCGSAERGRISVLQPLREQRAERAIPVVSLCTAAMCFTAFPHLRGNYIPSDNSEQI